LFHFEERSDDREACCASNLIVWKEIAHLHRTYGAPQVQVSRLRRSHRQGYVATSRVFVFPVTREALSGDCIFGGKEGGAVASPEGIR
jgi:hypothetical protein